MNFTSVREMKEKFQLYMLLYLIAVIGALLYLFQMVAHIRNVGKTMYFLSLVSERRFIV